MEQNASTQNTSHRPTRTAVLAHLRQNWYLPISAMGFFLPELQGAEYDTTEISLILAFLVIAAFSAWMPNLWQATHTLPWYAQCWVLLSALGVCWHCGSFGSIMFSGHPLMLTLADMLGSSADLSRVFAVGCALLGFPFVYVALSYLWVQLWQLAKNLALFSALKPAERLLYILLAAGFLVYAGYAFYSSTGFYSATNEGYDIVYTADTDSLFNNMAYLALTFVENDLRQPLFAVFSAPFAGAPYLLAQLAVFSTPTQAVLLNSVQVLMILTANLMLTHLVCHTPVKRVCFMLALSATYTTLLNAIMLEQYVTAYFWLMVAVCTICTRTQKNPLGFFGATGSLLTSVALLPWMSSQSPRQSLKGWVVGMIKTALGFVVLMLACARFDVIYSVFAKLASLFKFTGGSLPFSDRLKQYLSFLHDCFFRPAAQVSQGFAPDGILSWRLDPVTSINVCGVILLVLILLSGVLNRDKLTSRFALYWSAFSFLLLAVIGWGTWEIGLILYSLYFGWALFTLIFQLIEWCETRLGISWLLPLLSAIAVVFMLWINVPGIREIIDYCTTLFPT